MIAKAKKMISVLFKNKRFLLPLFFVALFIFFIPLKTEAGWVTGLLKAIAYIPNMLIGVVASLLLIISSFFVELAESYLQWVISPNFTTMSYTGADGTNPIITIGLDITQGLANVFLVLVLVFIALATILRLADYEAKKLLKTFIIVALLVNFSPVICGIIIDASNILMNFFLKELADTNFITASWKAMWKNYWQVFVPGVNQFNKIAELIALVIMNCILATVFYIFGLVFLLRYIAIWILVILSPLAFVSYILPVTKGIAKEWWKQFFQWCIIGITCGFFLYLGAQFLLMPNKPSPVDAEFGSAILPHVVPIVFFILALVFGLQTGAMGASTAMNLTKRGGKWAGTKGLQGTKRAGAFIKEKALPERVRRWGERQRTAQRLGEGERTFWGWTKRSASAPYYHARRAVGKAVGGGVAETQVAEIRKMQEQMKGKSVAGLVEAFHKAQTDRERIGILAAARERGVADQVDQRLTATNPNHDREVATLQTQAERWLNPQEVRKIFPNFAKKIKEAMESFKDDTVADLAREFNSTDDDAKRIGILKAAHKNNDLPELLDRTGMTLPQIQAEINRLWVAADAEGSGGSVARILPHMIDNHTTVNGVANVSSAARSLRAEDIGSLTEDAINLTTVESTIVMDTIIEELTEAKFREGYKRFGPLFISSIEDRLDQFMNANGLASRREALEAMNQSFHRLATNPASNIPIGGL